MSEHAPERIEKETARVEAFSDGVFAIAITLLVLEIKVPHEAGHALWKQLLEQWPSYFAFVRQFIAGSLRRSPLGPGEKPLS